MDIVSDNPPSSIFLIFALIHMNLHLALHLLFVSRIFTNNWYKQSICITAPAPPTNLSILRLDHLGALPCQQGGHGDPVSSSTHFLVVFCANLKITFLCKFLRRNNVFFALYSSVWIVLSHGEIKKDYRLQIITRCGGPNRGQQIVIFVPTNCFTHISLFFLTSVCLKRMNDPKFSFSTTFWSILKLSRLFERLNVWSRWWEVISSPKKA